MTCRYQKRGFMFGYIANIEGLETGDLVAKVVEGKVDKVQVGTLLSPPNSVDF